MRKHRTTVEPLSKTLRDSLLYMVDKLGSHNAATIELSIGAGTLSHALKDGAGRTLRGRLERGYARWKEQWDRLAVQTAEPAAAAGPAALPVESPTPAIPPIFAALQAASDNGKKLNTLAWDMVRIEKKLDALLIGFGLDPKAVEEA